MDKNEINIEEKEEKEELQSEEDWMPINSNVDVFQRHLANILNSTGLLLQQVGHALVFASESKIEEQKKVIEVQIQGYIQRKIDYLKGGGKEDPNIKEVMDKLKSLKSLKGFAHYLLVKYGITKVHLNLIQHAIMNWTKQITNPCPFQYSLSIKNISSIGSAIDDFYEISKSKVTNLDLVAKAQCPNGTDTEISPPTVREVPNKCAKIKEWKISSNPDRYSSWKKDSFSNSWVARLNVSKCSKRSLIFACVTVKCECLKNATGKKKDSKCQDVECKSCILVFLK